MRLWKRHARLFSRLCVTPLPRVIISFPVGVDEEFVGGRLSLISPNVWKTRTGAGVQRIEFNIFLNHPSFGLVGSGSWRLEHTERDGFGITVKGQGSGITVKGQSEKKTILEMFWLTCSYFSKLMTNGSKFLGEAALWAVQEKVRAEIGQRCVGQKHDLALSEKFGT